MQGPFKLIQLASLNNYTTVSSWKSVNLNSIKYQLLLTCCAIHDRQAVLKLQKFIFIKKQQSSVVLHLKDAEQI